MDLIVLIWLPKDSVPHVAITYKNERIQCVPVPRERGRGWQAPRRKQSAGREEISSCWPQGIQALVCRLGSCFLCFTFDAAGESGAALVLTTGALWKRDCKRGQRSNMTNQIIWYFQGWLKEKDSMRCSLAILRKTQIPRKSSIFFFERQTVFII